MIEKRYLELLKEFETDMNPHGDITLLGHLVGTYKLLERWNNSKSICIAGLFHSIYGTMAYKISSVDFDKREYIQSVIGKRAEKLAYLFCVTNRRDLFYNIGNNNALVDDIVHSKKLSVPSNIVTDLIKIEAANIFQQIRYKDIHESKLKFWKERIDESKECISDASYDAWQEFFRKKNLLNDELPENSTFSKRT